MPRKEAWALQNKQGQFKRQNKTYDLSGFDILNFQTQMRAKKFIIESGLNDKVWKPVKVKITITEICA